MPASSPRSTQSWKSGASIQIKILEPLPLAKLEQKIRKGMVVLIDQIGSVTLKKSPTPLNMELYSWERKLDLESCTYYIEMQALVDYCRKTSRRENYCSWPHNLILAYLVTVFRRDGVDNKAVQEAENMLVPGMKCMETLVLLVTRIEPFCLMFDKYRTKHTQLGLLEHVVDYDWNKYGLNNESFYKVMTQEHPLMSVNMAEAFHEKDGPKLGGDPETFAESAAMYVSGKRQRINL